MNGGLLLSEPLHLVRKCPGGSLMVGEEGSLMEGEEGLVLRVGVGKELGGLGSDTKGGCRD